VKAKPTVQKVAAIKSESIGENIIRNENKIHIKFGNLTLQKVTSERFEK
jgi:hypothetical protein